MPLESHGPASDVTTASPTLLEVQDLHTYFFTEDGVVKAVDGVDFEVRRGEIFGLVGESGCGKSVTAMSILQLIDPPGQITGGRIVFDGLSLLELSENQMVDLRGSRISMVFQQPQSSLNPVFTIGSQVAEVLQLHQQMNREQSWKRAVELLRMVGIPDAEGRAKAYPHEMSGGQAQRVMIAMALALNPQLLIADEPTTALDVTIQAQILDLMRELSSRWNTSVVLITHDLGVVAEMAQRVAVMYAGRIVEQAPVRTLFDHALHPYTQGLIASIPVLGKVADRLEVIPGSVPNLIDLPPGCRFAARCQARLKHSLTICTEVEPDLEDVGQGHRVRCWLYQSSRRSPRPSERRLGGGGRSAGGRMSEQVIGSNGHKTLIRVEHLTKHFPVRGGVLQRIQAWVQAVDDVSFEIREGETLGLVGESGCGKTTVGRTMLRLLEPTGGKVTFDDVEVFQLRGNELKAMRRNMQIIFQDPYSSLDPRMPVGESVGEGLRIHRIGTPTERRRIVQDMLHKVGLEEYHARRYPHEFSGGQRQRIGIARGAGPAAALHRRR